MKKFISLFLAIVLTVTSVPAFAAVIAGTAELFSTDNAPTISVKDVQVNTDTATAVVEVWIENNPGISSAKINVGYDDEMILTGVRFGSTFENALGTYVTAPEPYTNPQSLSFISPTADFTQSGLFATLTFNISNVSKSKESLDVTVEYDSENTFNAEFEEIAFETKNGKITFMDEVTVDKLEILTTSTENRVVVQSNKKIDELKLYVAAYEGDTMLGSVSQSVDIKVGENTFYVTPTWDTGKCEYARAYLWDENLTPYAEQTLTTKSSLAIQNARVDYENNIATVDVVILKNPGISSLKVNVGYDSNLKLTKVDYNTEVFGSYITAPEPYKNPQTISLISPIEDVYADGVLATLTFDTSNVPEGYEFAHISIDYDKENTFNGDFEEVTFSTVNGKISFDSSADLMGEASSSLMALEPLTLTVGTKTAMQGKTVDIDVIISNNPGISALKINVAYDKVLTLQNVTLSSTFPQVATPVPYQNPQPISLLSPLKEVTVNGALATLTFLVAEDVENGYEAKVSVTYDKANILDMDLNEVEMTVVNGSIKVLDFIPGDVNDDGTVNLKDAVKLFRYVADVDMDVNIKAIDVTGDGVATLADAVILFRYAAGWDIELIPAIVCEHELTETEAKAATCTEDGNKQFWHCSKCDKYFTDADAKVAVNAADTVVAATDHTEEVIPAVTPTYTQTGLTEGRKCSVCGIWTVEQEIIPVLQSEQHSITYIVNAGDYIDQGDAYLQEQIIDNPNPQVYSENELVTLQKLSTPGYTFDGWVDQTGKRWDVIPKGSTENLVLYAKWTQNVYTVTFDTPDVDVAYTWYDSNLGTNVNLKNAAKYTIDTGLTLINPTAYKYTFVGWSNNEGFIVSEIKPGTTGNMTLHANWTSDRNRATSYSNYGEPIIIEDYDHRQFLFIYDIGKIDNVPLYTYKKSNGEEVKYSNTTVDFTSTTTLKAEFGRENAQNVAKTVANATTRSSGWTLSEEWEEIVSEGAEDSEKIVKSEERTDSKGNVVGDKYFVSNSEGGSSYSSVESGSSSSSSARVTTEDSFGINSSYDESTEKYCDAELNTGFKNETEVSAGISLPVKVAKVEAGVKNTTTVTADATLSSGRKDNTAFHVDTSASSYVGTDYQNNSSAYYNAVSSNSTNWNSNTGYEKSAEMSQETTVSEAIAREIQSTTTYNISKALGGAKENTESVSGTTSDETGYSNSITVSEYFTEENVYAESHKDDHVGYHRLVQAGIVHVYGVVGYDVATASYYTYTFNVLEDETYSYWDYSLKDPSFTDCENGLVTFEIPFEVNEYIAGVTGQTEGLEIDIDDNGFGYVRNFEAPENFAGDVVVPQYTGTDNLDDTNSAVIVTGFSASAFRGNKDIKTVILPMYVTEIPDYAFEGCTNLETVIAYGVTKIGAYAFKDCENLGKFVNSKGETEFGAFMIDNLVTELGEGAFSGVNEIKVMAYDSAVADAAIASGAKKITVDLTKLADDYTGTKEIGTNTEYFGLIGGGKTFSGLKIKSAAKETFISNMTLVDNTNIPLELSSETVSLLRVTVDNAPGLALSLSAENTNLKLYRTVTFTSKSDNSVLSKNVTLSKANSSVTGTLDFSGNYLVCGKVTNTSMLKYPENVKEITADEFAKYMTEVTVGFDTDGDTEIASVTTGYDTKIGAPQSPTKDHYSFLGWYTDEACTIKFDFDTAITSDITLYAKWELNEFKITFDANGGTTSVSEKSVIYGTNVGALPTPIRSHYIFDGWYTGKTDGAKYTDTTVFAEATDITLYARWTITPYTVKWSAGTGTTITVKRTSSPNANASIETLSSGAAVYYGDVLSITYAAKTGYTLATKGATSITVASDVTTSDIYATATVNSYTAKWSTGTGYTIAVKRTSSPNKGASTGTLSSGATVYYGDVLSITYSAATGYTLATKGATSITVTGNVTSSNIYATATANSYTYNIEYVSTNGTTLGTSTATYKYNTTNTISPKSFTGYTTPSSQSVVWDSTSAKTITFKYTPTSVGTQTLKDNAWWWYKNSSTGIKYTVKVSFSNRTASSVKATITWTNTILANTYYGYYTAFDMTIGGKSTGTQKVTENSTWASQSSSSRSKTKEVTITISGLSATQTSVSYTATPSAYTGATCPSAFSGTLTIPAY